MERPYYKTPIFRPPSEAGSLLIQATEGCTHRCTFCISNYGKKYLVRPVNEIKLDIDAARGIYGPGVERLFFLDGNAMSMPTSELVEITRHARDVFPHIDRVGVYACGEDVLSKSDKELQELANAGLGIAYVGLESGDDAILKQIKKNITSDQLVQAARKLMRNGITFSGTIIAGITGKDERKSRDHAIASATMINKMCPGDRQTWYIGVLTLMIPPHTVVERERAEGKFQPMDEIEIVKEVRLMLEHVDDKVHDCVFRSNHASNYVVLKGVLADEKQAMLKTIDGALDDPRRFFRPEWYRGL